MATFRENADIIRTTARQFRAIIELADQIGEIDNIESQSSAKQDQLTDLDNKIAAKNKSIASMDENLRQLKEEEAALRADMVKTAAASHQKAKDEAVEIVAEANSKMLVAHEKLDQIKAEEAKRTKALEDINNAVTQKTQEFNALQARIDKAKKSIMEI